MQALSLLIAERRPLLEQFAAELGVPAPKALV